MADNRKYYYLKLKESYFDDDAIVLLESMPDGILYSNILLKLYLKSLKNGGTFLGEQITLQSVADGKLKIYQYGHGGDAVVALWAGDNRRYEVEFQLPFPYEQAIAFDWQGRRGVLPGKLDGNRIKLPVDFKVQYIVNKGK